MKEYACGDVVPGCGARFQVSDETQMMAVCTLHAEHDHGLTAANMSDDLVARVRAAIIDV